MTPSERTRKWQRENPEKHAALEERMKLRRAKRKDAAIAAWRKAAIKSPGAAIRAFCKACRAKCSAKCPLYPFKWGVPAHILRGRKTNNLAGYTARRAAQGQNSCDGNADL